MYLVLEVPGVYMSEIHNI